MLGSLLDSVILKDFSKLNDFMKGFAVLNCFCPCLDTLKNRSFPAVPISAHLYFDTDSSENIK